METFFYFSLLPRIYQLDFFLLAVYFFGTTFAIDFKLISRWHIYLKLQTSLRIRRRCNINPLSCLCICLFLCPVEILYSYISILQVFVMKRRSNVWIPPTLARMMLYCNIFSLFIYIYRNSTIYQVFSRSKKKIISRSYNNTD